MHFFIELIDIVDDNISLFFITSDEIQSRFFLNIYWKINKV